MLRDPEATASIEQADRTLGRFAIDLHQFCREEPEPEELYRSLVFFRSMITAPCGTRRAHYKETLPAVANGRGGKVVRHKIQVCDG